MLMPALKVTHLSRVKKCPATCKVPGKPLSEEKLPKIALWLFLCSICRANPLKNNLSFIINNLAIYNAMERFTHFDFIRTIDAQVHKTSALLWGFTIFRV